MLDMLWDDAYKTYCRDYIDACVKIGHPVIRRHKDILGKQDYTFSNFGYRFWVWEVSSSPVILTRQARPSEVSWRIYVNPRKGICFEVPRGYTEAQAIEAWKDYKKRMGV
jgi:hypothetical protein